MKKPKAGDVVEITWVDSGLEATGHKPEGLTLDIATTCGRVVSLGVCPRLADRVHAKFKSKVLVLEMCSSQPTLALILWSSVIGIRAMT